MKRIFTIIAASMLASITLQAQDLNIYASGLTVGAVDNTNLKASISYTLNAPATSLAVILQEANETPIQIAITDAANLTKGAHSDVAVDLSSVPSGTYSWSIKAEGAATGSEPVKLSDNSAPFQFYLPRGLAIDNSFESPHFGSVYVSEGMGGAVTGGRTTYDGIYIYTPTLDAVNTSSAYSGNIPWNTGGSISAAPFAVASPHRICINDAGIVYIADGSTTNSGIYVMDPAQPENDFISVFGDETRDANGTTGNHGPVLALSVTGSGANTVLYTVDRTYVPSGYTAKASGPPSGMILKYAIGDLPASFTSLPEVVFENAEVTAGLGNIVASGNWMSLVADSRGGYWVCQYRGQDGAAYPCIFYVDSNGNNVSASSLGTSANTLRASMAINKEENLLAVGSNKFVKFFDIAYDAANVPSLTENTEIASINLAATNIDGLAFDAADNLYALSGSTERFYVYALPKASNAFTTPAPSASTLTVDNNSVAIWEDHAAPKIPKKTQYFDLTGKPVADDAAKGFVIKKTIYEDGSIKNSKEIK